tara:strand:- start:75 stop:758 length:684 start_codon:yes stop_codon:yes gene_type:complete
MSSAEQKMNENISNTPLNSPSEAPHESPPETPPATHVSSKNYPTINSNKYETPIQFKQEENNKEECCLISLGLLLTLLICCAFIVYDIYCIIALANVSDKTVRNRCEGSILWRYVLASILVPVAVGFLSNNKSDDKDNKLAGHLCCLGIGLFILSIFGGIELFENSCTKEFEGNSNLEHLEQMALISFGIQVSLSSLMFISACVFCGCSIYAITETTKLPVTNQDIK